MEFVTQGDHQRRKADVTGKRVKQTWWCCDKCKVNLCCAECFEEWDHSRAEAPALCTEVS